MKKPNLLIGILIVILVFTSCSNNNDDNSTNNSNIVFNPPEWIIGTWIHDGGANGMTELIFTSNDVIDSGGMSLSDYYNLDPGWVLRESSNSNTYKYAVYSETMGFTSWNREFKKIDENTLIYECCPSQPFIKQ